jgi:hypothetical protein
VPEAPNQGTPEARRIAGRHHPLPLVSAGMLTLWQSLSQEQRNFIVLAVPFILFCIDLGIKALSGISTDTAGVEIAACVPKPSRCLRWTSCLMRR